MQDFIKLCVPYSILIYNDHDISFSNSCYSIISTNAYIYTFVFLLGVLTFPGGTSSCCWGRENFLWLAFGKYSVEVVKAYKGLVIRVTLTNY